MGLFYGALHLGESGVGMSNVTTGVSDMMNIVTTMITTILGNAVLTALLAAGFITVALKIFKRLKKAARS